MKRVKAYLAKHRTIIGIIGAFGALVIAAIYIQVLPEEAARTTGLHEVILRYGHSVCWILLAVASVLWGLRISNKGSKIFAYGALATYGLFIVALIFTKIV